jgi:hypothetical protein
MIVTAPLVDDGSVFVIILVAAESIVLCFSFLYLSQANTDFFSVSKKINFLSQYNREKKWFENLFILVRFALDAFSVDFVQDSRAVAIAQDSRAVGRASDDRVVDFVHDIPPLLCRSMLGS